MSLNHRQRHQLYRIESRLLRSDPQLVAMLAVFARLSAGQGMPAWEQLATRRDRVRQRAAQISKAIAVVAATASLLVSAVLALCTAIFIGSRARPPQPAHQQTGPGTES
jgi:Protein of unknown function (DUF3040)